MIADAVFGGLDASVRDMRARSIAALRCAVNSHGQER